MVETDVDAGDPPVDAGATAALAALGEAEARQWEQRCRATEGEHAHPWPEDEARMLVEAVLASLFDADGSLLEPAARAWALGTGSMPVLVARLGCLRELFTDEGLITEREAVARLQRLLDKVTTLATEATMAELEDAALTDPLTGAGNRRALDAAGRVALAGAARTGTPVSVVVIDLDGLKAINDTRGHAAGDDALAALASALRVTLRDTDQLFRIGGDEFVALLPLAPAESVAELLSRAQLQAPSFSWGVAAAPKDAPDLATLLQVADNRLYAARRAAGYYGGPAPLQLPSRPPAPAATSAGRRAPVRRHRHRPRTAAFVLAALLPVGAVLGLVAATSASHASQTPPPGSTQLPPGRTPPPGGRQPPPPGSAPAPGGTAGSSTGPSAPTGAVTGGTTTGTSSTGTGAPPPVPTTTATTMPPTTTTTNNGSILPPLLPPVGSTGL